MLLACHAIMQRRYKNTDVAMSALMQWIAYQVSAPSAYDYATPTVTLDMHEDLYHTFDLVLLKADRWDWLGELALTLGLDRWVSYTATREQAVEYAAARLPDDLARDDVLFDPLAGTGRLFFALLDLNVDCIMAGTEPLHKPYRLLALNKHIYDLPVYVIRAYHKVPFASKLWWHANRYLPVRSFSHPAGLSCCRLSSGRNQASGRRIKNRIRWIHR